MALIYNYAAIAGRMLGEHKPPAKPSTPRPLCALCQDTRTVHLPGKPVQPCPDCTEPF